MKCGHVGSDGTRISSLEEGVGSPQEGTRIFNGDADNVAGVIDLDVVGILPPTADPGPGR